VREPASSRAGSHRRRQKLACLALSTRLIVTDSAFVYWINDDAGTGMAIAK
jgi:hypothetical protein